MVMRMIRYGGAGFAVWLVCMGVAGAAPPPALYTAQQASAGAQVYTQSCAMCHGADLKGGAGPALIGQSFAAAGSNSTIGGVFTTIAQQMPESAPGSLSQTDYANVMAYILQENGYPAGSTAFAYTAGLSASTPLVSQAK
jgi:mono/diheme cytochrome c family protein